MAGQYEGMLCPHQPEFAVRTRKEGRRLLGEDNTPVLGVLGQTLGWKELLGGRSGMIAGLSTVLAAGAGQGGWTFEGRDGQ